MRLLAALTLLLSVTANAHAATHFVSPNGDDEHDGTQDEPWLTQQHAAENAGPGDVVIIENGTYEGRVEFASSGVTFKAAEPGKAVLAGCYVIIEKSDITLEGLRSVGCTDVAFHVLGPDAHRIKIVDSSAYDAFSSCVRAEGTPMGEDPQKDDWRGVTDFQLIRFKGQRCVDGGWNEGVTLMQGVDGFLLEDVEIWESGDVTNGGEGIDLKVGVFNGIVRRPYVHDLKRLAIYLDGGVVKSPCCVYSNVRDLENIQLIEPRVERVGDTAITIGTEGSGGGRNIDVIDARISDVYNGKHGILLYRHPSCGEWAWSGACGTLSDIGIYGSEMSRISGSPIRMHFPHARAEVRRNSSDPTTVTAWTPIRKRPDAGQ